MYNRCSWLAVPIATLLFTSVALAAYETPVNDGYVTVGDGVPATVLSTQQEEALEKSLQ